MIHIQIYIGNHGHKRYPVARGVHEPDHRHVHGHFGWRDGVVGGKNLLRTAIVFGLRMPSLSILIWRTEIIQSLALSVVAHDHYRSMTVRPTAIVFVGHDRDPSGREIG